MKSRIHRALNIKLSESDRVFDLLSVQFCIGLANALVNVLAYTLFIYSFPVKSLPLVYLAMAGMLMLLNLFYEKLENAFSPPRLLSVVMGFSIAVFFSLWALYNYGSRDLSVFMLLVTSAVVYMVTGYAFWGLVSLLFNVRESRRVFSIVGAGDLPAKLIGYLAAPVLIHYMGAGSVLCLGIFSLAAGLFIFERAIRKKAWADIHKKGHGHHGHAEETQHKKSLLSFFVEHKLIFGISVLSLLSYNVFVLVDFTFITQVKFRAENFRDLVTYIAVFSALGRLFAMAFKLIFTSRVIEKLGVVQCLFITPVSLFLICLVFFFIGDRSNYNLYIFGMMAMLTEVLRSTMQEPVFFILFQPLKENLRLKGHLISKGFMYPPSLIIVGLSLFFLFQSGMELSIQLAIKVLLLNLLLWAGVIFFIRKQYLRSVHDSIKKGIFSSDEFKATDPQTIDLLLQKIENGGRIEVIYALHLLEKSSYPHFHELLERLLATHPDVDVQKCVLDRIEHSGKLNLGEMRRLLHEAPDPEIREKAALILCRHDAAFVRESAGKLEQYEDSIRKIMIINLLNQREFNYLFKAGTVINNLLNSSKPEERILAIEIIGELKRVQFSEAIATLIKDPDPSVRRQAVQTACAQRMAPILPELLLMLHNPDDHNMVIKSLYTYGDPLFEDIRHLPGGVPAFIEADLIRLAARIKGKYATSYLLSELSADKHQPKDKLLHALWAREYEPASEKEELLFQQMLANSLRAGHEKILDYSRAPEFSDKDLICRAVYNEVKADLAVSLKLCVILYQKKEINRILELMEMGKQDKLYNAMEMLELMLPKKVSRELNGLFDFILDPLHQHQNQQKISMQPFFNKLIFDQEPFYNPWTRSVSIYSSWKNGEESVLEKLKEKNGHADHFLVKETRDFVLSIKTNNYVTN